MKYLYYWVTVFLVSILCISNSQVFWAEVDTKMTQRVNGLFEKVDTSLSGKTEIQKIKRYNFIIIKLKILQKEWKNLSSEDTSLLSYIENQASSRVGVVKKNRKSKRASQKNITPDIKEKKAETTDNKTLVQESDIKEVKNNITTWKIEEVTPSNLSYQKLNIQLYPAYDGNSNIPRKVRVLWDVSPELKQYLNSDTVIQAELTLINKDNTSEITTLTKSLSKEIINTKNVEFEIPDTDDASNKHNPGTYFVEMKIFHEIDWKQVTINYWSSFETFLNINGKGYSSGGSSSGGGSVTPGEISTLVYDLANEDNEFDKQILPGDSIVVGSFDVRARNQAVGVSRVEIWLSTESGTLNIMTESFDLLLNGIVVSSSGALDNDVIYFNDITQLEIGEITSELALQLNTSESSQLVNNISMNSISLDSMQWVETGRIVDNATINNFQSTRTSIVPALITPSVIDTFNVDDNNATIRIISEQGDPLCALLGICQDIVLDSITLEVSSLTGSGNISIFNTNGINITAWGSIPITSGTLEIPLTGEANLSEIRIQTSTQANFRLARNGIKYSVNTESYTTILENTLNLWQYVISN